MLNKIQFKIKNLHSENDRVKIETEIEVLAGVRDISVDISSKWCRLEYEDDLISRQDIFHILEKNGFHLEESIRKIVKPAVKEKTYYVQGMHCASCEILIEKKILGMPGVRSVEASTGKAQVVVEGEEHEISTEKLNKIFSKDNYIFFNHPLSPSAPAKKKDVWIIIGSAAILIVGFIFLKKLGIANAVNVTAKSSLPMFFLFGLIAGVSSCAALVGGLVLSMSKQWQEVYSRKETFFHKFQPHLLFNIGRLVSYGVLGAVLGLIGSQLKISITLTAVIILGISIMMIFLALQMLGVKAFQRFQITMPRFMTRYIADESNFKGKYMPAIMGALTFFLPCGFTITAQGLALISGNPVQGGLIMMFFALGTSPMLMFIGLSSIKFSQKPHPSYRFLKVAGILVLFFALYNINAQLNVLGWTSLSDLGGQVQASQNGSPVKKVAAPDDKDLPPIVDGKQVLKMNAASSGYTPNYFKVRAGVPVRWEINDTGTSGCTNAIISKSLFDGQIALTPGQVSTKEFTVAKAGKYKFSCWMGMISGTIEVVDTNGSAAAGGNTTASATATNDNGVIPSGAKGCGCGGGGSGSAQQN